MKAYCANIMYSKARNDPITLAYVLSRIRYVLVHGNCIHLLQVVTPMLHATIETSSLPYASIGMQESPLTCSAETLLARRLPFEVTPCCLKETFVHRVIELRDDTA